MEEGIAQYKAWDQVEKRLRDVSAIHWILNLIEFADEYSDDDYDQSTYDKENYTLIPYIGMRDIDGTPIYKHYILEWEGNRFVVVFSNLDGRWYGKAEPDNKDLGLLYGETFRQARVVGNLYEGIKKG